MDARLKSALDDVAANRPKDPGAFSLRAGLDLPLADEIKLTRAVGSGLRLVQWTLPKSVVRLPATFLWQLSKQGVWHHLAPCDIFSNPDRRDTAKFVLDNPNIVHSFTPDPDRGVPEGLRAYDRVAPLPGLPVWSLLPDPDTLLHYLSFIPNEAFLRLRWDEREKELFFLGERIRYHFCRPRDLPEGVLDRICRMVEAGGSVDITHVRSNLEKAYLIAYATENGVMVGDSSLKHPRQQFVDRLRRTVNLDFSGFVERGYTSVRPEYRALGVGKRLLEGLTARAGDHKVFSIIGEDNPATQKIALRNHTRKILTYFSEKAQKRMGIWMPAEMVPLAEKLWGRQL